MSSKIGLALSGGGFRATCFHLGVLKQLDELGIKPDVVAGVSGGAIAGALYATHHERLADGFSKIESAVKKGIRGNLYGDMCELFRAFCFRNLPRCCGAHFAKNPPYLHAYEKLLGDELMRDCPSKPALIVGATNEDRPSGWIFTRDLMGYPPDFVAIRKEISVSCAVAVSAALPPFLPPWILPYSTDSRQSVTLSDGGLWSNLAVQYLFDEKCEFIILSDASAKPDHGNSPQSLIEKAVRKILVGRLMDIVMHGNYCRDVDSLRRGKEDGGLNGYIIVSLNGICPDGVPPAIVRRLTNIRTDLNPFTDEEVRWLIYHGYTLARHRFETHGAALIGGRRAFPVESVEVFPPKRVFDILNSLSESHFHLGIDRWIFRMKRRLIKGMKILLIMNGPLSEAMQRANSWEIDYEKYVKWAREHDTNGLRSQYYAGKRALGQRFLRFKSAMERIGCEVILSDPDQVDVEIISHLLIEIDSFDRVVLLGYRKSYRAALKHITSKGKEVWIVSNSVELGDASAAKYYKLNDFQIDWLRESHADGNA